MGMLPKQPRTLGRVGENSLFFTSDQKHFNMLSVGEISNSEKGVLKFLGIRLENQCKVCSPQGAECTWGGNDQGLIRISSAAR